MAMPSGNLAELLPIPQDTSSLTASPHDNLHAPDPPWISLHTLPTHAPPEAFWHVIEAYTHTQHWNRTIFSIEPQCHLLTDTHTSHTAECQIADVVQGLQPGSRYDCVRTLRRKTPAPVGGEGDDRGGLCYDAVEWVVWTAPCAPDHPDHQSDMHAAAFGLCIPNKVVTPTALRAQRYWPFQYPKVRAYRFSYTPHPPHSIHPPDPTADHNPSQCATISYEVLPLGDVQQADENTFEVMKKHSFNSAVKMLTQLRKRMHKYDSITQQTTYIKRVHHDALLSEAQYRARYDVMKQKYSFWVHQWTECTDPVKFVYEELSIAAYLCALWEKERDEEQLDHMQSFIDCGCGNGFLVYLLISEGHPGIGVDLRSRAIWDKYPQHVTDALKEENMDPTTYDVSPYDWVLGNHSDELSPWLPVMSARCQRPVSKRPVCTPEPTTFDISPTHQLRRAYPRFFVLPCCFFDFDGKKVAFGRTRRTLGVRVTAGKGKYELYYRWIAQIARAFGFTVEYENLRIPSTKYVSLTGRFIEFEERISDEVIREMTSLLMLDANLSRG